MREKAFVPSAGADWLLPLYDPLTRLLGVARFHRHLLDQAAITPGCRVLEVGCGTGNLAILAKRLNPAAEVIGIDPDRKALARARRKAKRAGIHVRFDPAYSEELPFRDASFDRVLSALMLHHLAPHAKVVALREVRRVLKPRGSVHLADFEEGARSRGLHGVLARLLHSHHGATVQPVILRLMGDAGLADSQEVARHASVMGPIVYYRAVGSASAAA